MFNIGDTIVHNRYGAGTVAGFKSVTLYGEKREYLCIELAGGRGTLMVQPEEVDLEEVRMTMDDLSVIRKVFEAQPETLSDQHRSRQPKLNAKLHSNDPKKIAQVLRDLIYRDRVGGLTETDKRIRDTARNKLLAELKLSPNVASATNKLNDLIEEAMAKHFAAAS
jgi:RNA polymerase-interacting CarD/CdnL/TRCF family regulator